MNFKIKGYIGAALEIYLFTLISSRVNELYNINFDNTISYYWLCFTILTGIWECFYIFNYNNVINMSSNLILHKQHVWTNKYNLNIILPWNLSYAFYSEYGAYADREYMTNKDKWSRIIEGTHSSLCGLFSLMTIYFFHNKLLNNYSICLGISMGSQLMNSILYCGQYLIQTKNKNSINYNSSDFPCGKYLDKRPFMWINIFWFMMPSYVLFIHLF